MGGGGEIAKGGVAGGRSRREVGRRERHVPLDSTAARYVIVTSRGHHPWGIRLSERSKVM